MNWKIGQKIVCVAGMQSRHFDDDAKDPIVGEIYTIRGITSAGGLTGFYLVEIKNIHRVYKNGFLETAFDENGFRPVVDIGDEVEEYIKSKIEEHEYAETLLLHP